jgi:DGQHR domain-containing protein
MGKSASITVRAVKAIQAGTVDIYSFFLFGGDITKVADISRISRDELGLKGFQRREIRSHVNSITEFLDSGPVIFPNAILLALAPDVEFISARGRRPDNMIDVADTGTLTLPIGPEGRRSAWIVDGQQRSLALAKSKNPKIPIPVVGFVSANLETHREQFILVNKARPLPNRLINELLPEVGVLLPRDLASRQVPSALCDALARDPGSPFYGIVKRESAAITVDRYVSDTALIEIIRSSMRTPLGALGQFKREGVSPDIEAMYGTLLLFWSAVKGTFNAAWGRPPTESRLMHSAGLRAVGALMDPILLRAETTDVPAVSVRHSLERLAPYCAWTEGNWDTLDWRWNEIQSTSQHISRLTDYLVRLDRELSRAR